MKTHKMMLSPLIAIALAATACVGEADPGVDGDDEVTSAEQEMVGAPMMSNAMIWPMGSITWDGMIGTWPIAVWSSAQLDFIAFNLDTFADLSLTVGTMDTLGVFTPLPGISAVPITSGCLNTISAGLTPSPLLAPTPMLLPSMALDGVGVGMPLPIVPTITNNALMLTGLPLLDGMSPLIINVSFNAASAASIASLSVFAVQAQVQAQAAATSAALTTSSLNLGLSNPALSSMLFPITAPFIGAPVSVTPALIP
jgi:hypothetical protein